MVQVGVDVVDTDGVHTQHLHESGIAKAVGLVAQRVYSRLGLVAGRTAGLVCDSHDLEPGTGVLVDEERALHINGGHGSGQRGSADEAKDSSLNLEKTG